VRWLFVATLGLALLVLSACESTPPYVYHYVPGRTAQVVDGRAVPPPHAPFPVWEAISAGNEIVGLPYRYGGGHANFMDSGYDCSGATSYVLHAIGRLASPQPSQDFRGYGQNGPGQWISVYATNGHVFLVVAGVRLDTGYSGGQGPNWSIRGRPADGYVIRHPPGL
jgi:cell wall-associated NlpC family hydrolase